MLALALTACSEPPPGGKAEAPPPPAQAAQPPPVNVSTSPLAIPSLVQPSASPIGQAIDKAAWGENLSPDQTRQMLIRAQVLLSRAYISPGVIDGKDGDNLKDAVRHFEEQQGLPVDGKLDKAVFDRLAADGGPAMTDYVITDADVKGPFVEAIPKDDYRALAKLERLAFTGPREMLAERFHMDEDLLVALNPGANFGQAGTRIVVAAPMPEKLPAPVTLVEVDKKARQVRAYAADGKMLASYPATIGSSEMPTPAGQWEVTAVAFDPVWTYDPSKLNFGDKTLGKLTIKPGPNNPVGAVWIDLSKDTYGIHGAADPKLVGKAASHGCVRLTNWDARQLASAVGKGTKVTFVGEGADATGTA
ncbi:L,D-transpeptidase [Phenylobacterium sp. J367]|uniref:L,D-transpeptidase family protein n=1 Tax=Phenylobacterium sp. J367 TaxID=2898435 RepID=UPI002150949F|nr:L,D-transpeptidase [Phenylobacterium sp. J367]MCR5878431.1 L,D-transpeptidase [Phenylobacterium sp. J367]